MLPNNACTGCAACANICPCGAISLRPDGDGFLRPVIDANGCTRCAACEQVCPVLHPLPMAAERACYALRYRDEARLKAVSSGGGASAMGEITLQEGGAVYGVRWAEGFRKAVFDRADTSQNAAAFAGTKYIQAEKGDVYRRVFTDVQTGMPVLFVGLPCEVAGLKAFLGGGAANLACVQLVCHGATSPRYLADFVQHLEHRRGSKIVALTLREKAQGVDPKYILADFERGKPHRELLLASAFGAAFTQCSRESCYDCPFKKAHAADVTIGDFWGLGEHPAQSREGVSLLITHTPAGNTLAEKLLVSPDVLMAPADLALAHAGNPRLDTPAPLASNRARRMASIRQFGLMRGVRRSSTLRDRMKLLFYRLPAPLRKRVLALMKK